jgi:hypothetical protein
MPTLNIGGQRVKVGDEFLGLSPEDQESTVEEIAGSLGAKSAPSWGETFETAKQNMPGPVEFLKSQFTNPIDDVKNVGKLVLGGAEHALGFEPGQQISNEQEVASDFAKHYGNYLSEEGIKENIATNPVGVMTDALGFGYPAARVGAAAVRRGVTPFPARPGYEDAHQALQHENVPQTAGQRTGSRGLKYAESTLGGGRTSARLDAQSEAFTRAASHRIGEDSPHLDTGVINRARQRIGNDFNQIGLRNNIPHDPQLAIDLGRAVQTYVQSVPMAAPGVQNIAQAIAGRGGQGIPGNTFNAFRSRLSRMQRNTRDPQLQAAYGDIREALDDAMNRSMQRAGNQADIDALATARQQWRNLVVLENAMATGPMAGRGLLTPQHLESAAAAGPNRTWYSRGVSDFSDLGKAARVGMEPMPESGTAARIGINAIPAAIGGLLGGGGGGAVGAAVGAVGGRMAAGRALMSRPAQAYLGNQLWPPGPPVPGRNAASIAGPTAAASVNSRKESLGRAEKVLGPEVMKQVKQFAPQELNAWLSNPSPETTMALASTIAQKANRPELVERIISELSGQ